METFILKIYRMEKDLSKIVGTLQNINSDQHFSFTTQRELCVMLASMLPAEDADEADTAAPEVEPHNTEKNLPA